MIELARSSGVVGDYSIARLIAHNLPSERLGVPDKKLVVAAVPGRWCHLCGGIPDRGFNFRIVILSEAGQLPLDLYRSLNFSDAECFLLRSRLDKGSGRGFVCTDRTGCRRRQAAADPEPPKRRF